MVRFWGLKKWESLSEVREIFSLTFQRRVATSPTLNGKNVFHRFKRCCVNLQELCVVLSIVERRAAWSCTLGCRFFSGLPDCVVTQEGASACYCHFWLLISCCWWEANRTTWVLFCTCMALGHSHVPVSSPPWLQTCRELAGESPNRASLLPSNQFFANWNQHDGFLARQQNAIFNHST